MDYVREFDIRLEKEMYYAGEILKGHVFLETVENFKLKSIRIIVRGKAHVECKITVGGDDRNVEDEQSFIDLRDVIFGKDNPSGGVVPILPRGVHKFPFRFQLPESALPCSFESKRGCIRYYVKVTLDIPYASPPQGTKYFTIIGPYIDCMDEQYLKPMIGRSKRSKCCFCCKRYPTILTTQLERSAYVCGESIKLKATIDNQGEEDVRLKVKLLQHVEYCISRGVLGVSKENISVVFEVKGDTVKPNTRSQLDSADFMVVPIVPPSLSDICRLIQIYYVLKVSLESESKEDDLQINFPVTIATIPFRIPNSNQQPILYYGVACDHAEGGKYIGPEFLLGQVYDGMNTETIVLYRPVYVAVKKITTEDEKSTRSNSISKANSISLSRLNSF